MNKSRITTATKEKTLVFLVIFTAVLVGTGWPQQNLLKNGDFESWTTEVGPPESWRFVVGQSPSVLHKDTQVKRSGHTSLRFDFALPNNIAWVAQLVGNIHPDTEYRISGFIKMAPDAKIPPKFAVEPNLGGLDLPGATEWTPWEWTFNSREAEGIMPQFRFRGIGSVWLDDLRLTQVSEAGAKMLPDRKEILKLLEYQAHPVPPETNTDEWTKPYCRQGDVRQSIRFSDAPDSPCWKVGQWARYLCRDELLVLSKYPEKRPSIMLIDCAIVGKEKIGGKTYFWYQIVVRLDKYWVARSTGLYDSGKKILLATPRKAVLSFLVEGPAFKDIRRYQLKIDEEPLLEYTDGKRAVLPKLNIDHALIIPRSRESKPAVTNNGAVRLSIAPLKTHSPDARESTVAAEVPVTGIYSFEYHASQLDRSAVLVNWGDRGAKDERKKEKPITVRLARPPFVAVSFDGFGELKNYREMAAAGAELFQNQRESYLGEARAYFNAMPAYFYNNRRWDTDLFDIFRSNLLGFSAHLDEPYQRQRKLNEYIKRDEVQTLSEAGQRYSSAIAKLLKEQPLWPGEEVMDYNSPASAAWYSARVGASGFVLENARLTQEMADIERITGKKEARALADEINIACLRGAARRFGIWWGMGIYRWVPDRYWKDQLVNYTEQGARYVGFWVEGKPPSYDNILKALPEIARAIKSTKPNPRQATVALVVPDGYVVGLAGSVPETPWGIIDFPQGKQITTQIIARAAELFDKGIVFDIIVATPNDPNSPQGYEQTIRIGF